VRYHVSANASILDEKTPPAYGWNGWAMTAPAEEDDIHVKMQRAVAGLRNKYDLQKRWPMRLLDAGARYRKRFSKVYSRLQ
jgi:hypothetical protein